MNWLLLRGLGRETRHWGSFPQLLQNSSALLGRGEKVVTLDLPGMGCSGDISSPLKVSAISEILSQKFANSNKSGSPWGLLAMSLGAMVAIDWIHRHPQTFAQAVLINTSAKNTSPPTQRLKAKALGMLAASYFIKNRERQELIYKMTCNDLSRRQKTIQEWHEIENDRPLQGQQFFRQLIAAATFSAPNSVDIPCLFLSSMRDRMVDPRCSLAVARRLNAPCISHPSAGHDLVYDAPDWVIEQMIKFAAKC